MLMYRKEPMTANCMIFCHHRMGMRDATIGTIISDCAKMIAITPEALSFNGR